MIIKEMKYGTKKCRPFILAQGLYKNHKYYVLSFETYPTAYVSVEANVSNMSWKEIDKLYDDYPIHCGISYAEKGLPYEDLDESVKDIFFIGWDYSHIGDYIGDIEYSYKNKKWTTSEIIEECKGVIDKMEPNYMIKVENPKPLKFNSCVTVFNPNVRYGWVCPLCGRVNSPDNDFCLCNGNKSYEVTTATKLKEYGANTITTTCVNNSKENDYDVSFNTNGKTIARD